MVKRFGKLRVISFFLMGIGLIAFLLTPLLYSRWGIDSDLPGVLVIAIGVVIFIIGLIRMDKPRGLKLATLILIASVLSVPILITIASLVYYLITRKPLG